MTVLWSDVHVEPSIDNTTPSTYAERKGVANLINLGAFGSSRLVVEVHDGINLGSGFEMLIACRPNRPLVGRLETPATLRSMAQHYLAARCGILVFRHPILSYMLRRVRVLVDFSFYHPPAGRHRLTKKMGDLNS